MNFIQTYFLSTAAIDFTLIVLFSVALFYIVYAIIPDQQTADIKRRLGVMEKSQNPKKTALLKYFYPFYNALASMLFLNRLPKFLQNFLHQQKEPLNAQLKAGKIAKEINPEEFVAFKFTCAFVFPILCAMFQYGWQGYINLLPCIVFIVVGYFFPKLWLNQLIQTRKKALLKTLPMTMDLLTLSVESGLDFIDAIKRLSKVSKDSPLNQELKDMLREIRLGASRSEALRNMSKKLQLEEVSSLTSLLVQSDRLGVSIGDILRAQSDQLRHNRFIRAEVLGAKASQLILLPLVFCVLPAAICVLLGPAILNFMQGQFF